MQCRAPAHQQLAGLLTALADEHRAAKQKEMPLARRVQQLDTKIEKKKRALETLEAKHRDVSEAFPALSIFASRHEQTVA